MDKFETELERQIAYWEEQKRIAVNQKYQHEKRLREIRTDIMALTRAMRIFLRSEGKPLTILEPSACRYCGGALEHSFAGDEVECRCLACGRDAYSLTIGQLIGVAE